MPRRTSMKHRLNDELMPAFGMTRFGRWLFTGPIPAIDKVIMPLSKGKLQLAIGHKVLLLRATGAKSSELRVCPVIYTPRGASLVIVASRGGDERNPAWYHNVIANPAVEVEVDGRRRSMTAREATGQEREDLWAYVTDRFAAYGLAQDRVERTIPVVVLDPR